MIRKTLLWVFGLSAILFFLSFWAIPIIWDGLRVEVNNENQVYFDAIEGKIGLGMIISVGGWMLVGVILPDVPIRVSRSRPSAPQQATGGNRTEFIKMRFGGDWAIFSANGGSMPIALEYNPDSQHFMLYRVRDENERPKKQRPRFSMADNGRMSIDERDNYALFLGDRRNLLACCNSTPDEKGNRELFLLSVPPTTRTVREAVAWTYGVTEKEYAPLSET